MRGGGGADEPQRDGHGEHLELDGHDAVQRAEQQVGTVPQRAPARAADGGDGRDGREEEQQRRGDQERDRVADDHEVIGGQGAHLNHPSRGQRPDGDADVGHRPQIGPELLGPVPAVVPDEWGAGGRSGRLGPGRRADDEDERPEAVRPDEAGRGQRLDHERGRVDTARSVAVRQVTDRHTEGEGDQTRDAEPDPHSVRRKVDGLSEVQDPGGQIETAADGVDEVRGREDPLRSGIRHQVRHDGTPRHR